VTRHRDTSTLGRSRQADRLIFIQARRWQRLVNDGDYPYDETRCAYCARPVAADAARLRTARTNDGEWWLVAANADLTTEECALVIETSVRAAMRVATRMARRFKRERGWT